MSLPHYVGQVKSSRISQALVAHAWNPSYSIGRDQGDHGSKPAQANSLGDPISKKTITKNSWWSGSGVGLEFKPQYCKKKKKKLQSRASKPGFQSQICHLLVGLWSMTQFSLLRERKIIRYRQCPGGDTQMAFNNTKTHFPHSNLLRVTMRAICHSSHWQRIKCWRAPFPRSVTGRAAGA
jgi:hypothetical protein